MNYKGLTAALILAGSVATPIGLTIANSANAYQNKDFKVLFASASPVSTLNMFKADSIGTANSVVGLYNTALIKSRPNGDDNGGLETSLSISQLKLEHVNGNGAGNIPSQEDFDAIPESNSGNIQYSSLTPDLANSLREFGANDSYGVGFNIRNTRFWNGDRVTAEDFINTIKIALDARNAVPWAWTVSKTVGILNAKEIIDAQNIDGLTFEEALAKYPLGVTADPSSEIKEEDMSTSADGKEYYKQEYAKGNKRHSKLIYSFNGAKADTFISQYAAGALATPTSIRKFDAVGIDNWGTTVDDLMGSGPYKIKYFDLDYKIIADKWSGYWDANRTLSPQVEIRILPDSSSQIQLFREGKIGKVTFGTAMLPQFLGNADLKKYVKPTDWGENLFYLTVNTKIENSKSKYLLDSDFRNAIQYSIDRQQYLSALGADNSYSTETFSTMMQMTDSKATGVVNNAMDFDNQNGFLPTSEFPIDKHVDSWDKIYDLGGSDGKKETKMFTRNEDVLSSTDVSKNGKFDTIHNLSLAKEYFASFKKNHPEFNGTDLKLQVPSSSREQVSIIKQDIENNLPGVKVTVVPKADGVEDQLAANMDWDIRFSAWQSGFLDSWTYYHLLGDKVVQDPSATDDIAKARLNQASHSDGFGLMDYIAQRLQQDTNEGVPAGTYFAKHYFGDENPSPEKLKAYNNIIAQFLRMNAIIGSDDPDGNIDKKYDADAKTIWTRKATKDNEYRGFGGEFAKFDSVFPGADTWGTELSSFIDAQDDVEMWHNKDYRYSVMYPFVEKLIRESAIGMGVARVQNSYIASRFIGEINFTGQLNYFGWVYQADNIPPTRFALPGVEAITK